MHNNNTEGGAVIHGKDHTTLFMISPYPFEPKRQARVDESRAALYCFWRKVIIKKQ